MDEKKRQRYLAISEKLAELVGGKKNIQGIAHCEQGFGLCWRTMMW